MNGINIILLVLKPKDKNQYSVVLSKMLILALTVLVALAVAFYPSRRAAKINPIEALKHE
jgi:ABC-type antimicrobial peptide transport system permease subunit